MIHVPSPSQTYFHLHLLSASKTFPLSSTDIFESSGRFSLQLNLDMNPYPYLSLLLYSLPEEESLIGQIENSGYLPKSR